MPSTMMLSDSMFPRFTDETTQGEKIEVIYNYLYQLLEQLRYTLGNLSADNFNSFALTAMGNDITAELDSEVQVIRQALVGVNGTLDLAVTGDGIITRLNSTAGSVSQLTITAAQLKSRMEDAEGDISEVSQTAAGLEVSITDSQNAISELQATASGLKTSVSNLETTAGTLEGDVVALDKKVSTIEQTAEEIELRVISVEGDIDGIEDAAVDAAVAEIKARAKDITMSVTNNGTSSYITLNAFGVDIESEDIELTGYVTFDSLTEEGETEINGANITTGDIEFLRAVSEDEANGIVFRYGTTRESKGIIAGSLMLYGDPDDENSVPAIWLQTYNEYVNINIQSSGGIRIGAENALVIGVTDAGAIQITNAYTMIGGADVQVMFLGTVDFSHANVVGL